MATWAIGDVHGCYRTLRRLLGRRAIGPRDSLWFVGDLVNRGPRSLETLRFVADLGDRATVVLGNHDLHFLARAAGVAEPRKRDTLEPLLAARDLSDLVEWTRSRPFLAGDSRTVLVHAGLRSGWTRTQAAAAARRVERALRGPDAASYLEAFRPFSRRVRAPRRVRKELLEDLRVFTLLRTVSKRGAPLYDFAGPPRERPRGSLPWFEAPGRRTMRSTVVFGHWAALGLIVREREIALDTGCAWGGTLTAIRLEDRRIEQTENID